MRGCDLLICIEPTRGVDVGAKVEIYRQLEGLARDGAAVLVVSTDLPEMLGLSDRIVVLWRGHGAGRARPAQRRPSRICCSRCRAVSQGEQRGLLEAVG